MAALFYDDAEGHQNQARRQKKKKRRSRFTLSSLRFLSSVVGRLNITVQLLSTDLILSAVKHKTFPGSPSCFFFLLSLSR